MKLQKFLPFVLMFGMCNAASAQQVADLLKDSIRSESELDVKQLERFSELKYRAYSARSYILRSNDLRALVTSRIFPLSLPGSKTIVAKTLGTTLHPNGSITWLGTFDNDPSRVTFVVGDNSITGRIKVQGTEWSFYPLGGGYTALIKLNQSKMPPDGTENRIDHGTNSANDTPIRASKTGAIASTIIDVLVLYTLDSASNIDDEMESARDLANAALDNSEIDIDVRIIAKVASGISTEPALNTCDGNPNCNVVLFAGGTLVPNAASLRNQYGADIVVLVSDGGGAKGQAADVNAASGDAYIMVNKQFASSSTLGHEIGHIIGGIHDIDKPSTYDPSVHDFPEGHGYYSDDDWPDGICTMMTTECTRDLYFSDTDQYHIASSTTIYHGMTNWATYFEDSVTEMTSVWGQRASTVAGFKASIGGAGGGEDPPEGNYLEASLTGPAQLGWKEYATLYASGSYQPDDDPCTLCTYEWFERQSGGSWYSLGIFTSSYYMSMLWTSGIDYKVRIDDGLDTVEDTHHINYCSSGCGGGPKRGNDLNDDVAVPIDYALSDAYPNPFNPATTITYDVPTESVVLIEVFDLIGYRVATLVDGSVMPGRYQVAWTAEDIPSGVYLIRLKSAGHVRTRKVILLK